MRVEVKQQMDCMHADIHIKNIPPKRLEVLSYKEDTHIPAGCTGTPSDFSFTTPCVSILVLCQYQCALYLHTTLYCKGSPVLASSVLAAYRDPLLKYITFYNL